jgi:hypothetical protein
VNNEPVIKFFYYEGKPLVGLSRVTIDFDLAVIIGDPKTRWINGGHKLPVFKSMTRKQVKKIANSVIIISARVIDKSGFEKGYIRLTDGNSPMWQAPEGFKRVILR